MTLCKTNNTRDKRTQGVRGGANQMLNWKSCVLGQQKMSCMIANFSIRSTGLVLRSVANVQVHSPNIVYVQVQFSVSKQFCIGTSKGQNRFEIPLSIDLKLPEFSSS